MIFQAILTIILAPSSFLCISLPLLSVFPTLIFPSLDHLCLAIPVFIDLPCPRVPLYFPGFCIYSRSYTHIKKLGTRNHRYRENVTFIFLGLDYSLNMILSIYQKSNIVHFIKKKKDLFICLCVCVCVCACT